MEDNRFTSMLNECYGGRKAIRTFLITRGKLVDIRLPPLGRIDPAEGRRPEAKPRARPNAAKHTQVYFARLIDDMRKASRPPPSTAPPSCGRPSRHRRKRASPSSRAVSQGRQRGCRRQTRAGLRWGRQARANRRAAVQRKLRAR